MKKWYSVIVAAIILLTVVCLFILPSFCQEGWYNLWVLVEEGPITCTWGYGLEPAKLSGKEGDFYIDQYFCDDYPIIIGVTIVNVGDMPIRICSDGHCFWDFISFEAAHIVKIDESQIGNGKGVFKEKEGEDYYKIQPLPENTFRYEIAQKVLLVAAEVYSDEDIHWTLGGGGVGKAIPEDDFVLQPNQEVEIVYFIRPNVTLPNKGPYTFRLKIDCARMRQFLPDTGKVYEEDTFMHDWGGKFMPLGREPTEKERMGYMEDIFATFAITEEKLEQFKQIVENKYPNCSLYWNRIAEWYFSFRKLDKGIHYLKKCYGIVIAQSDEYYRDGLKATPWRYFSFRYGLATDIGIAYAYKGDYETALEWCNKALNHLMEPGILEGSGYDGRYFFNLKVL